MSVFEQALDHVFQVEGLYSNDTADSGGPTKYGITLATLRAWRGKSVTIADVKALTLDEARAIYKKNYWDAAALDTIDDPGVAIALFDQVVNRGISGALKLAQQVMNQRFGRKLTVDGKNGTVTQTAFRYVCHAMPAEFVREYIRAAGRAYADICARKPSQVVFMKGWLNRLYALEDRIARVVV